MLSDKRKFIKRRTVQETPTLRPIEESPLAQIYQLSVRLGFAYFVETEIFLLKVL